MVGVDCSCKAGHKSTFSKLDYDLSGHVCDLIFSLVSDYSNLSSNSD